MVIYEHAYASLAEDLHPSKLLQRRHSHQHRHHHHHH